MKNSEFVKAPTADKSTRAPRKNKGAAPAENGQVKAAAPAAANPPKAAAAIQNPVTMLKKRSTALDERLIEFIYEDGGAREVSVAGSFNNWEPGATTMKKDGNGTWRAEVPLKPGAYQYRFVVDGNWREDAEASEFAPNPFGGVNSVLVVRGS